MMIGISKKNAWCGTGLKFVSGVKLQKAETTKYTQVVICGMTAKEAVMRSFIRYRSRGKEIK